MTKEKGRMGQLKAMKKQMKGNTSRRIKTVEEAFQEGLTRGFKNGYERGAKETIKFYSNLTTNVETLYEVPGIGPERYSLILHHLGFPQISIKESKQSGIKRLPATSQENHELGTSEQLTAF
jgi:hypothetical protein